DDESAGGRATARDEAVDAQAVGIGREADADADELEGRRLAGCERLERHGDRTEHGAVGGDEAGLDARVMTAGGDRDRYRAGRNAGALERAVGARDGAGVRALRAR